MSDVFDGREGELEALRELDAADDGKGKVTEEEEHEDGEADMVNNLDPRPPQHLHCPPLRFTHVDVAHEVHRRRGHVLLPSPHRPIDRRHWPLCRCRPPPQLLIYRR